jgi:hypothetical protein
MVVPPWTLISPTGVIVQVDDVRVLKTVAKANGLIDSSYKNQLAVLVDVSNKKTVAQLPRHRCGWQLLQRVQWLTHVDTGEMVPIIGGDATKFVSNFDAWCNSNLPDDGSLGSRLTHFLNDGWCWSNTKKVPLFRSTWALSDAPPPDAAEQIERFVGQASALPYASIGLPDYGLVELPRVEMAFSRALGSPEVNLSSLSPYSSRSTRWDRLPHAKRPP